MFTPLRRMIGEPEGRVLAVSAATALVIGTIVYSILEGWSLLDSLYFSVVTLATVGFGDLHPTTDPAKLFTIVYIFTGIGILAGFVSELTKVRQSLHVSRRLEAVSTAVHEAEMGIEDGVEAPEADRPPADGPTNDA
jgi:voltage-gated potassium channel